MESLAFKNANTSTSEGLSENQKRQQKCKIQHKKKQHKDRLTKEIYIRAIQINKNIYQIMIGINS